MSVCFYILKCLLVADERLLVDDVEVGELLLLPPERLYRSSLALRSRREAVLRKNPGGIQR